MFGKPEWFKFGPLGLSYRPICWQGWLYLVAWSAVLLVPFWVLLLALGRPVWSVVWLAWAVVTMMTDVRMIYGKAIGRQDEEEWNDSDADDARR